MPIKQSKWKVVSEIGLPNSDLSVDQERVEHNYIDLLAKMERDANVRLPDDVLVQTLMSANKGMDAQAAADIVMNYRNNPNVQQQTAVQPPQPVVPEIENPVSQEDVLNVDSTVESEAMSPTSPMKTMAKYPGKKHKKNKKGDKRHLKGKGPKADKANEIYHAIMRDRDGKGEPTKEEQASAAAIAWSQAKKTMKKKAYFRGEEAKILDSYRGMWGEELVRLSVHGQIVDVPRETIEFVSTEVVDPVHELKTFVSHIPETAETRAEIQANLANLKTAKDIAYRLVIDSHLSEQEELSVDAIHASCERRIEEYESHLASAMTDQDVEYLDSLPQFEIGREVFISNFSREEDGWMDEIIEKMAAEAEEIDIDKLIHEDPIVFVSSLSEEVIANSVAVRNLATERVSEIAGPLNEEVKKQVVASYLEKAESTRQKALSSLKMAYLEEVQSEQKTASSIPDEGLFL